MVDRAGLRRGHRYDAAMTGERTDPPYQADERAMLVAWLDYHRATLAMKCQGLGDAELRERAVPPSSLSLLGLVRHMVEVERNWFRRVLGGEDAQPVYYSDDDPDGDFDNVADADPAADFATFSDEVRLSRAAISGRDLDERFVSRRGANLNLRWVFLHMIEEYARHNGHADLIRERIDGTTGD